MKKIMLFITLILLTSSFTSCKKDIDEEQEKSFRLKEITTNFNEGDDVKVEFLYDNNNLSKINLYEETNLGNWNKTAVSIIEYQADIISVETTFTDGFQKNVTYTFNNNLLTHYSFTSDSTFDSDLNIFYEYNNQLLSKKVMNYNIDDITEYTFLYNNKILSEIQSDNSNQSKRVFEYSNSKMSAYYDTRIISGGEWYIPHMYEFIYENDYLKKHNFIIWNNPNNIDTTEFNYDTTGLLSSVLWKENDVVDEFTFISEEGESNLGVFIRPDKALYPYPEYYSFIDILDRWFF